MITEVEEYIPPTHHRSNDELRKLSVEWTTINLKQFHAILKRINNWFARQEDNFIVYYINDIPFVMQDEENNIYCQPTIGVFWYTFLKDA